MRFNVMDEINEVQNNVVNFDDAARIKRMGFRIVDRDFNVIPPQSMLEVEQCLMSDDRIVEKTQIIDIKVSTVFLCVPHGLDNDEYFESMIFAEASKHEGINQSYVRARNIDEIRACHKALVKGAHAYIGEWRNWRTYKRAFGLSGGYNKAGRAYKWR